MIVKEVTRATVLAQQYSVKGPAAFPTYRTPALVNVIFHPTFMAVQGW